MNQVSKLHDIHTSGMSVAMELSLSVIDSLGRAGLVIAPEAPTEKMLEAGSRAGGIDPRMAERIYSAMIAAQE